MDLILSLEEYKNIKDALVGSLVCMSSDNGELGINKSGIGIILDSRREEGKIYVKVAWTRSPFFRFKDKRKIGWHSYERLFIIQSSNGVKNYANQSKSFERK